VFSSTITNTCLSVGVADGEADALDDAAGPDPGFD